MQPEHAQPGTSGHGIDPALLASILAIIRRHAGGQARHSHRPRRRAGEEPGLSEHALIAELRRQRIEPFADARLREPLSLFRTHFLLFHCLYRLRDECVDAGEWLRIDCLDIGLEPLEPPARGSREGRDRDLAINDPLRAYYLDLSRLDATDAAAVEALLGSFWRRLRRDERREHALAVLGLEDPVEEHAIQARYRSLVQRHHPDRGGDAERVQRFNEARWILMATDKATVDQATPPV